MPPPTPVDTVTPMKSASPTAAPRHPSARARALASLSTNVGRPVASAIRARRGKPRQAGMLRVDTSSPPVSMGPPQPTPQATTSPLPPTDAATAITTPKRASGSSVTGVAVRAEATTTPSSSTRPAASLVPPMSIARTTSTPFTLSHPLGNLTAVTAPITTTPSPVGRVSVEEFLAGDWPAGSWLVDGEVVVNDPGFQHQEVVARILRALAAWCDAAPDRGRAGFGGNWIFDPYTLLKPDVWWSAVIPTGNHSDTPPDLAVEVRSPTTWRYDVGKKRQIYGDAGVAELWLVDPPAQSILVWRRPPGMTTFDAVAERAIGDDLTTPLLPGFQLSVDKLFAGSG